ncbi:DUF4352 domain-containing protein [Brachybacterium sp. AOP43-C2-M15]|uniref:DUF4352 domain-containing protein n=1 Tax=Brachybacterium sp. AOP43-C2-M15 TaxID=3457661 RepID=UPI0040349C90
METDRDARAEGDRPDGHDLPSETGTSHSPAPAPGNGADPVTGDAPETSASPHHDDGQDYDYDGAPATGLHPATAPRAVLRPVPEGFPTPPPRPALPNRRPAPRSEPSASPRPRRGLLIAAASLVAVLVLAIAVGGGILAVRALSADGPQDPPAASGTEEPAAPSGAGQVQIGEVAVTEVSTEVGLRSVGTDGTAVEPEGEYVVVTFAIDNRSSAGVEVLDNVTLLTADGESVRADREAGQAHVADSSHFGVVEPDGTATFHMVYDVPIGTEPTGLQLDLSAIGESGELPLDG